MDANGERLEHLNITPLDGDEDEDEPQNDDVEDDVIHEDDDEEDPVPMTLGFAEEPKNSWSLLRQYFPSKAGGTPAWLDPVHLPSEKSTLCDFCSEPLQFLLQHEQWRRHPDTQSRSVKVFRCQLHRANSFYSSEAPAIEGTEQPMTAGALLCSWCGTWKGDKICSGCRIARYCCMKHQVAHWRSTNSSHRVLCRQAEIPGKESEPAAASNSLWPQYEITNKDDCEPDNEIPNDNESVGALISRGRADGSFGEFETYFNGEADKRSWASFQERLSLDPDQILRYSSAQAKPLWPVSGGRPSEFDIPKCSYCGGKRGFEFQVLPQLLYFFHVEDGVESLDWATIVVYTCEASCKGPLGYREEFAWVQLAS